MSPDATFVVPARDEADHLPRTLDAIAGLDTDHDYRIVVTADRRSDDGTLEIAHESDAEVVEQESGSIGRARDLGAWKAGGEWLAFVDADTRVAPTYLDAMLDCVRRRGLAAASSRCRITGPRRAVVMQGVINRVFPRLHRPILTGFNFFVDRSVYEATGGFPDVPNEDTAYSRRLGRTHDTGYCRGTLVETSGRRIAEQGLSGALAHYLALDARRLWDAYRSPLDPYP